MCKIAILKAQTINCERKKDRMKKMDTVSESLVFTASEFVVRNIFGRTDRTSAADCKTDKSVQIDFRVRACSDCRFEPLGPQKALSVFGQNFSPAKNAFYIRRLIQCTRPLQQLRGEMTQIKSSAMN